ncbi:hypothetical protein GJ744_011104 [Endocarpon pusillum]|uniref:DUF1746 domain-containing protein n=1 Tax=Endocarpon pusillum TaxID=364733 RepID=A0A8H7AD82_9EURO|nr:hypothetical protein GJ744_011104 [Endocarpon pusillum]
MNPAFPSAVDDPLLVSAEDTDAGVIDTPPTFDSQKRVKQVELLENLLRSFDALIYLELSALYYLDCAFGLLILHTIVQLFFLSERPPGLPAPPTRSALGAVIGSNLLCTLLHLLKARPEAGEASHFYLHGSIIIDFVGQLGPTSKWRLYCMDTLVLALQVGQLAMGIEKRRLQAAEKRTQGSIQDLDAEEAGIIRSESSRNEAHEGLEGMELQELLGTGQTEHEARSDQSSLHVLDEFYTGNTILARLNVVDTISSELRGTTSATDPTGGALSLPGLLVRWRSMR